MVMMGRKLPFIPITAPDRSGSRLQTLEIGIHFGAMLKRCSSVQMTNHFAKAISEIHP